MSHWIKATKRDMKPLPVPADPHNVGQAMGYLDLAREELVQATMGYSARERLRVMEVIVRLAVIINRGTDNPKVQAEFKEAVTAYDQQYSVLMWGMMPRGEQRASQPMHKSGRRVVIEAPRRSGHGRRVKEKR